MGKFKSDALIILEFRGFFHLLRRLATVVPAVGARPFNSERLFVVFVQVAPLKLDADVGKVQVVAALEIARVAGLLICGHIALDRT